MRHGLLTEDQLDILVSNNRVTWWDVCNGAHKLSNNFLRKYVTKVLWNNVLFHQRYLEESFLREVIYFLPLDMLCNTQHLSLDFKREFNL